METDVEKALRIRNRFQRSPNSLDGTFAMLYGGSVKESAKRATKTIHDYVIAFIIGNVIAHKQKGT